MKRKILIPLCIVSAGLVLSGCASRTAGTTLSTTAPATANPTASMAPSPSPEMTMEPEMTSPEATAGANGMVGGADRTDSMSGTTSSMTPAQAGRLAEQIAEAVERLSEVDDAQVLISGSRALVAVEFDDQYSAGLDDRMKQMITETVQEIDETLTQVSVTDDDTLYGQVKNLGERFAMATGMDELADDFGDLWDRITGK